MVSRTSSKENLLDFAISAFASSGFSGTSLRSIAKTAGVSPALLVHHFENKDKLIELCIDRALGEWIGTKSAMSTMPLGAAIKTWESAIDEHGSKLMFFRQLMIEGGEHADLLFRKMVSEATAFLKVSKKGGLLKSNLNLNDLALIMTLHGLGPLVMQGRLNAYLGGNFTDPKFGLRLAKANAEIYTNGIFNIEKNEEEK